MTHRIVAYPAVFDQTDNEGWVTVTFPDVPGAITQAKTLPEAMLNAEQALGLMLYDEKKLPAASSLATVEAAHQPHYVALVASDLDQAAQTVHVPYVRKNTRIPAYLAEAAEQAGINFSATLTRGLEEDLQARGIPTKPPINAER
ncbi:type II toxin-antitoxin system HicB family antitoxin [Schleiferilactobacillus shenzhenensis]|nr:type II toxin-antitoxin system HicB family antitoxin [Schleiferilactobacillus shenzhenensis]